jgi:Mn2+/Fe2+ NRAMP family transporter
VAVLLGGLISMAMLVVGAAMVGEFSFESLAATLERRLGTGGGWLLAWGLFAAGLSSAITAPLAASVTARSLFGTESSDWSPHSWRYRSVWIGVLLVGVAFGLSGVRPVPVIILAQALNGILLPFAAVFLLLVVNDRELMGDRLNGALSNVAMALVVMVAVVLGTANVLRAAAAALDRAPPNEGVLLAAAILVALVAALPVARSVARRRRSVAALSI